VAAKKPNSKKELKKEVKILRKLNHPHVIKFFGTYKFYIILEYAHLGDLEHFVAREKPSNKILVSMARQLASGMEYLHSSHQIIHGDLAARNILVQTGYQIRIADFGLSEHKNYETRHEKVPFRWSAPEVIERRQFSKASDVWSFGIVLWEMWTKGKYELPYYEQTHNEVAEFIRKGLRLEKPDECPEEIYTIMKNCWNTEQSLRPEFEELGRTFDNNQFAFLYHSEYDT